jgi:hypothetical protein
MRCLDKTHLAPCQLPRGACFRQDRRAGSGLRRGAGRNGAGFADGLDFNLYGLQNFSAANYLQTANPGGEAGIASGFVIPILFVVTSQGVASASRVLHEHWPTGVAAGWSFVTAGTNTSISFSCFDNTGTNKTSGSYTFTASDVGRVMLAIGQNTGSGVQLLMYRGGLVGATAAALPSYTPGSARTMLGVRGAGTLPSDGLSVLAVAGATGTPSLAQLQAYYDATRVLGDLPDTMQGATVTHLWSVKRELLGVTNPAGRKTYGARLFSTANYYQSAVGAGIQGSASGFWAAVAARFDALSTTNQFIASCYVANNGWYLQYTSSASIRFICQSAGTNTVSASIGIAAADIGQPLVIVVHYTGTAVRLYYKRAQVGADVAGNFTPSAGTTNLSASTATWAFTDGTIFAFEGGLGNPSLAEVQGVYDAFDATGLLAPIAGKTDHRWSFEDQATPPSTLADRIGSDALTRFGLDVHTDANAIRSVGPYSAADGFRTVGGGGIQGQNAGYHAVADIWLTKVPTASEYIMSAGTGSGGTGYLVYIDAAGNLQMLVGGVAGTASRALVAGDLNKRLRVTVNKTATVIQLFVNGVQAGADVACASFTANAATQPFVVGQKYDGTAPFGSGYVECVVGGNVALSAGNVTTYNADLTQAPPTIAGVTLKRWLFETDIAAAGGALPSRSVERISGGDDLVRFGGFELAVYAATAPAAPLQLTDRITAASADALARVGAPTVKLIDPTIDGRRTLAAQGFSDANGLTCTVANPGVIGASGGFTFSIRVRWDSVPTGNQVLAIAANAAGTTAWYLRTVGAALTCTVNSASSSYTVVTGDLGQWITVQVVFTSSVVRLFVRGVQVGTDQASTFPVAASSWMRLGYYPSQGFTSGAIAAASGGNSVATLAELQQQVADTDAASRLAAIPGKTDHLWELSTDILASGVDAVPATVLDRVGTDHLTRVGIAVQADANSIRGVGPYGVADGWQTGPSGGIQGSSAGHHVLCDVWLTKIPQGDTIVACLNAGGTNGWYINCVTGALRLAVLTSGTTFSSSYTVTSGDLNKRLRLTAVFTGNGGVARFYVNGVQAGADSATIASYIAPTPAPMNVAVFAAANSFTSGYVECVLGGNTIPSPANIATYNADLTQAPPTIAGVTLKRYVFESDIAAASGALPARSVERISGGDDMVRIGSPLVLAQRTERLFSYETAPLNFGAKTFSASDSYSHATAYRGSGAGFVFGVYFTLDSQSVASASRILAGCINDASNGGFNIYTTGTNTILLFTMLNAAGSGITSPTVVLSSSDVGKKLLVLGVFDGSKVRIYIKRAESGSGTTAVGFSPSAAPFYIGRDQRAASPSPADAGLTVHGWLYGATVPTLAEIQAAHDAVLAADDIAAISFKTDSLVSLTKDARATGALPAATVDQISAISFTKNGAPALATSYARAAGW